MGTSSEVEVARFFDDDTLAAVERLVKRGCAITWRLSTPDGAVPLDVMERLKLACFRRGVAMRTANVPIKGRLLVMLDRMEQLDLDAYPYPPGWPRCRCGDFAMDGKATCGRVECLGG